MDKFIIRVGADFLKKKNLSKNLAQKLKDWVDKMSYKIEGCNLQISPSGYIYKFVTYRVFSHTPYVPRKTGKKIKTVKLLMT